MKRLKCINVKSRLTNVIINVLFSPEIVVERIVLSILSFAKAFFKLFVTYKALTDTMYLNIN